MATRTTWKAPEKQTRGKLTTANQNKLPDSVFAFPQQRKEPLTNASHVRNAVARFNQVKDVTDADRKLAFANIKKAAKHFAVELNEDAFTDLMDGKGVKRAG